MATETLILHSDLNCYYASVEMNEHPELRGKKVAVCGSTENRHGIVLTANYPAKRSGVKTGMANWQAKQACTDLIMVNPHYDLYLRYSKIVRSIYKRYADCIEPFGMDENWISIPCCKSIDQDGLKLAEDIRKTVREETGLTVSTGVSFSKILAKLGSDMKKPDAVTVVSRENYKDTAWKLPVSDLLYVGPATTRKLATYNIHNRLLPMLIPTSFIINWARTDHALHLRQWNGLCSSQGIRNSSEVNRAWHYLRSGFGNQL